MGSRQRKRTCGSSHSELSGSGSSQIRLLQRFTIDNCLSETAPIRSRELLRFPSQADNVTILLLIEPRVDHDLIAWCRCILKRSFSFALSNRGLPITLTSGESTDGIEVNV